MYEPAHEIMVLITQATSEGSGEPAHLCSLARDFTVRTQEGSGRRVGQKIRHLAPLDGCVCVLEE